ncbi:MAG: hypothetical protein PF482_13175 [Desulfobacteraceae bacterium]|jgi:hypothetical protein|nr:hypothetical protein [Desulfobacteraceae bacterium]
MKKQLLYLVISTFISTIIFIPATMAASCCASEMAPKIDQKSEVDGYQFEYEFIDMMKKMKGMPNMDHQMDQMTATHHLMLFIKNAKGEAVAADMVGFLITGPDGKDQKVMTMVMGGGYGADIKLSEPGKYTVKTKAVIGDQKLIDEFTYTVK